VPEETVFSILTSQWNKTINMTRLLAFARLTFYIFLIPWLADYVGLGVHHYLTYLGLVN
jgi:hypothetical protein